MWRWVVGGAQGGGGGGGCSKAGAEAVLGAVALFHRIQKGQIRLQAYIKIKFEVTISSSLFFFCFLFSERFFGWRKTHGPYGTFRSKDKN